MDIMTIPAEVCHKIVCELRPVSFKFRANGMDSIGFIAQEVQELLEREMINLPLVGGFNGYLALPYAVYTALMAGAIQEQQREINELREVIKHGRH
mgnify:CR=1 FL=1